MKHKTAVRPSTADMWGSVRRRTDILASSVHTPYFSSGGGQGPPPVLVSNFPWMQRCRPNKTRPHTPCLSGEQSSSCVHRCISFSPFLAALGSDPVPLCQESEALEASCCHRLPEAVYSFAATHETLRAVQIGQFREEDLRAHRLDVQKHSCPS